MGQGPNAIPTNERRRAKNQYAIRRCVYLQHPEPYTAEAVNLDHCSSCDFLCGKDASARFTRSDRAGGVDGVDSCRIGVRIDFIVLVVCQVPQPIP